jgi:hypothetical protein
MNEGTTRKLGGTCSILVGVSYIVVGIAYLLLPAEQKAGADPGPFLASFAQSPLMTTLEYWGFALGAVFALAVVPAISDRVRSANEGWVRWTNTLATVGFAVAAVQYFRYLALYPANAAAYATGDAATRAAVAANQATMALDPNGWLDFGGVGLWFLVINLLALRGGQWPKTLAYVGIAGAIAYWLVVAGFVFEIGLFVTIAAAAAIVLGPIWYIWVGLTLRRPAT